MSQQVFSDNEHYRLVVSKWEQDGYANCIRLAEDYAKLTISVILLGIFLWLINFNMTILFIFHTGTVLKVNRS